jgi:serine/threonine-protein kinase
MGEVYLGAVRGAAGFEKQVAIKRILPHLAGDEEFVRRFIDEARIVVTLNHGNIVPVLDMGEEDGEYFIAMEYLPGKDLREVLRRATARALRIPPGLALFITAELCRGLAYAHRKVDDQGRDLGIVHRDVSPSNVILGWEGLVKLTDFGVAQALGRLSESLSGTLRGKVAYMSPEQALGDPLDGRSDIYSAGIVLWECLTGARLFEGDSDPAVIRRVQDGLAPPPSSRVPGLAASLDAVTLKALARNPKDRYADMGEFEQTVQRLLHAEFQGADAPALSKLLRDLFDDEATLTPAPLSLDDALAAGLPDLSVDDVTGGRDRTASVATPLPDDPAPAPVSVPRLKGLRRLFIAAGLGLVGGWLALHPSGPPRGSLSVTSDPAGAEVIVAGQTVGYTPWVGASLPADTSVEVMIQAEGRQPWRRSVTVPSRGRTTLRAELLLAPTQATADGRPGAVALPLTAGSARPWAVSSLAVTTDSPKKKGKRRRKRKAKAAEQAETGHLDLRIKPTGVLIYKGVRHQSPVMNLELPAGIHSLKVEKPEWGVKRRIRIEIVSGEKTIEVVKLEKPK